MRLLFMLLPWLELFTLIQLGIKTTALTALLYVLATLLTPKTPQPYTAERDQTGNTTTGGEFRCIDD